ncbi:MAG: NAD(P)H-dependent oxidoreductase subunit E [Proteobacteria bacterium]|nr:NAD(P)H-dependent oxidoreductase subunit E [Pseudomonadota bacterium]
MSDLAPNLPAVAEPTSFAFDAHAQEQIDVILRRYPPERKASAVIPVLYVVQNQMFRLSGSAWVPKVAMDVVAGLLDMAPIRVYEVGTFYTMFNLTPIGRYNLQICTTTPCWLRGSDEVVAACFKATGIAHMGGTSADGLFTMKEVECLGACSNAPMMQINDDYYEDLDGPRTEALLEAFRRGETPTPGSTIGRQGSMAEGGPTTLTDTAALWSPEKYAALKEDRARAEAEAAAAAAANPPAEPAKPEAPKPGA